ncbi:neprilysin-4 isoform X2 [Tribolium madens]|uniref:neprilysin-4 isoform X2 n=1 Tax=Tribolium madens TaxID=41895 RepID=UPI001CF73635|nr:neprilysin-4 isoform X2 [Tribolium madens]
METKKNFCSCRLAAHQESGRVRWCVGHEKDWQIKLKRMVFVPIILLPIVIFIVFLTRYTAVASGNDKNIISMKKFDETELLEDEDRRDLLKDARTSYAPEILNNNTDIKRRQKREVTLHQENFTDYEELRNDTDLEYYKHLESKTLQWTDGNELFETDQSQTTPPYLNNSDALFWNSRLNYEEIRELQASTMRKYMNESADPCEDFYEYACGNWNKYHTIPADRTSYDTFEMLRENLDIVLRNLLSEAMDEEYYFTNTTFNRTMGAVDKARFFYRSCMNEERLESRGEKPLIKLLDELGGWPIIQSDWDDTNFKLEELMANLKLYNNDILITEWIGPDIINSKNYIIQIDQTTLGLPGRSYFLDPSYSKYLRAYKVFILAVASILGAPLNEAIQDVNDVITFETKLANIMVPSENRRNVTDLYLKTSIGALQKIFPQFDWVHYFSIVLGKEVDLEEPIACYCMDFLHKLFDIIAHTPPRTISNYLIWRFVRHRTNNLDKRFLMAKQRFYHVLFGREKSPPRWQFCVSQVNSNMGMALGSLFVKKYFDENSKNDTLEMTKRLQEAFRLILKENKWLGDDTKDYARMKIDKMNLKIGYPDFLLDQDELSEKYYDVDAHPQYFFENTLSILRHLTRIEQKKIGTEVNKTTWGTAPAVVNAYYSRNKNQIIFPAGILQPPFYHKHFPKSLNFGGIGVVIGHEITHGFDDKGRLFDHYGNLQQWWKEDSIYNFHQRAKCMIDQYNSYIIPDVDTYMDGFITQGENIADNGGLKQAFKAYEMWLKQNPDVDETLPGINLTGRQLFFLNFAQVWCGKQRIDTVKSRLKVAVHAPGIFRVIGSLSNSEDFAKIYNCPPDSGMNPSEKCSLW